MDKKEIVKIFRERGVLLTPEMLEKINTDNLNQYLSSKVTFLVPKPDGSSPEVKIVSAQRNEQSEKIEIEVRNTEKKKILHVKDFTDFYNNKYLSIRNILIEKPQLKKTISINNAAKSFAAVSIIGMVREKKGKFFSVEDPTGAIEVIASTPFLEQDDVVGVKGFCREGKLYSSEIIFPDIPLTNQPQPSDYKILLTTKEEDWERFDYVIIPQAEGKSDKVITGLTNPSWIHLKHKNFLYVIFTASPKDRLGPQDTINLIKKRHFLTGKPIYDMDLFLLDPIPQIIWLQQADQWKELYKGIIIISSLRAEVDLKTFEVRM